MSIYKRGNIWWLYLVPPGGGKRVRRPTGTGEKARAQRIHDELKAELWKRRRGGGSLHGALHAWAPKSGPDAYRVAKLTGRTKKKAPALVEDLPLQDVTAEYLEARLPASTAGTFNRYANVVTAAWNKARKKHDLPPLHIDRKETPKGRVRWLTAKEWEALKAALPDHQRPMAELAIATGLRQANVFRLEWAQVDLGRRRAWIHADQAKAGEPIGIKLNDDAMRVLQAQQEATGTGRWVFVGKDGKKPPTEIKTAWKTACAAAGLSNFRWHDLRHTWATWHIMQGTPREALQKLGGWKDDRMVSRYAHLAESYVDQYADNAKPYQPRHKPRHTKKLSA